MRLMVCKRWRRQSLHAMRIAPPRAGFSRYTPFFMGGLLRHTHKHTSNQTNKQPNKQTNAQPDAHTGTGPESAVTARRGRARALLLLHSSRTLTYFRTNRDRSCGSSTDRPSPTPSVAAGIHPRAKRVIGSRLAAAARALVYGDTATAWTGPVRGTVQRATYSAPCTVRRAATAWTAPTMRRA